MPMTTCERWARSPAPPRASTANWTRVRQPSPGARPVPRLVTRQGLDGDRAVDAGQAPELLADDRRLDAPAGLAATRAASRSRRSRPGGRNGTAPSTRSGDGSRTRTASARAKRDVTSVTRATTRSPGSACRTNSTGSPSGRATHQPPWATSPMATSSSWPTAKCPSSWAARAAPRGSSAAEPAGLRAVPGLRGNARRAGRSATGARPRPTAPGRPAADVVTAARHQASESPSKRESHSSKFGHNFGGAPGKDAWTRT